MKIIMKAFVCLCLAGCMARSEIMTQSAYESVITGEKSDVLKKVAGAPYSVTPHPDGSDLYEYVEKISMGKEAVEVRRYYIKVKNGVVVSKRMEQEVPGLYENLLEDTSPGNVENN